MIYSALDMHAQKVREFEGPPLYVEAGKCYIVLIHIRNQCDILHSYAGLIMARVCHDHFERVVIVEAEKWLCDEDARRVSAWEQQNTRSRVEQYQSVQGRCLYAIAGRRRLHNRIIGIPLFSQYALEKLFFDLALESHISGMQYVNFLLPLLSLTRGLSSVNEDRGVHVSGHFILEPLKQYNGQLPPHLFAGRRGTETLLRRLVLDKARFPNIVQIAGTVTSIVPSARSDCTNLHGVKIRTDRGEQLLSASLVIGPRFIVSFQQRIN